MGALYRKPSARQAPPHGLRTSAPSCQLAGDEHAKRGPDARNSGQSCQFLSFSPITIVHLIKKRSEVGKLKIGKNNSFPGGKPVGGSCGYQRVRGHSGREMKTLSKRVDMIQVSNKALLTMLRYTHSPHAPSSELHEQTRILLTSLSKWK